MSQPTIDDDTGLKIYKGRINFDLMEFNKYRPYRLTKQGLKSINGLDTETLHGYAKLLCDDKGNSVDIKNINDILEFMTQVHFRNAHNFFYNIHFDINAIVKYLPEVNIRELNETLKTKFEGYTLFYIPRKIFRIICHNHVHKFFDVSQFFGGSLERNANSYLGLTKYLDPIDGATLGSSEKYWQDNYPAIKRYCINDCILTRKLGELLYNTLSDKIGLMPNAFTSEAGLTKEFVRTWTEIPDISKVPMGALKYSFYSYSGGRFEILQKGHVGECSLYDINSAYPFHIRDLVDITQGHWQWVRDLHESATYGFYLVKVYTKYNKISPINITLPNNVICYPMIECVTYMSKDELLAYSKFLDYEIIDGWEFFEADDARLPFKEYIEHVYNQKQQTPKDRYEYKTYKILMNGLYGCFYEKHKSKISDKIKVGKLFNPMYASTITARTRINLWEYAMQNIDDVVGFATDSVLFKGRQNFKTGDKLGEWTLEKVDDTIVLRSGFYKMGSMIKSRGVKKNAKIRTLTGEYNSLFEYILDKPDQTIYPVIANRPLSFSEILHKSKTYTLEDINIFTDIEYNIDINKDYKRVWDHELARGIDLLNTTIDSEPLVFY